MPEFFKRQRSDGKPGDTWWTNIHGRRVSTGCADLRAAQIWRRAREREGADPRHAAATEARLDDAIREVYAELRRRGRSEGTLKRAKAKLGHFARLWGSDCPLVRIDAKLISTYIDTRLQDDGVRKGSTLSRTTIRDELAFLRQLLKLARRNGLYAQHVDDVLPIRFESKHKPVTRWIPPEDFSRLLDHVEPRHAAHICFFVATGARLLESYRARREDVDMKKGTVLIRGSKTSLSKKVIPITPFMRPIMERALRDAEGEDILFRKWHNIQRDMKAACDRGGVGHVTPNDLRRSFGKWHRNRGFEPSLIAVLLRHSDDKLAQTTYATVDGSELGKLVKMTDSRLTKMATARPRYKNGTGQAKIAQKGR